MGVHCESNPVSTDHVYSESVCIHCGEGEGAGGVDNSEDPTSKGYMGNREEKAGIKTGDAILQEIPGNEKVKTSTTRNCPGKPPLDGLDINTLTGAFEMYGRIMAIQARIDGMKVANRFDEVCGRDFTYLQHDFTKAADNIYLCVQQLQIMRNVQAVQ